MKKLILILVVCVSLIGCSKDSPETIKPEVLPSVSKVIFASGFAGGAGNATVFNFTATVPAEGVYTKLALWATGRDYELAAIDNPKSGPYQLIDLQLRYQDRIPNYNYFLWTKKDGTTLKQPVTY